MKKYDELAPNVTMWHYLLYSRDDAGLIVPELIEATLPSDRHRHSFICANRGGHFCFRR